MVQYSALLKQSSAANSQVICIILVAQYIMRLGAAKCRLSCLVKEKAHIQAQSDLLSSALRTRRSQKEVAVVYTWDCICFFFGSSESCMPTRYTWQATLSSQLWLLKLGLRFVDLWRCQGGLPSDFCSSRLGTVDLIFPDIPINCHNTRIPCRSGKDRGAAHLEEQLNWLTDQR